MRNFILGPYFPGTVSALLAVTMVASAFCGWYGIAIGCAYGAGLWHCEHDHIWKHR